MTLVLHGKDKLRQSIVFDCGHNSEALIIAFTGHAVRGVAAANFEFRRLLRGINAKALFLRDPEFTWYQQGIVGVGDIIESVRYLRSLRNEFDAQRVITVGNSGGGYAAILYGVLMEAEIIIGFSPQTRLRDSTDTRFPNALARLRQIIGTMPTYTDLREVLQRRTGKTKTYIYYGSHNARDREHAERIRGLPGVTLVPFPTCHHSCGKVLARRGHLTRILEHAVLGNDPDVRADFPRGLMSAALLTAERLRFR